MIIVHGLPDLYVRQNVRENLSIKGLRVEFHSNLNPKLKLQNIFHDISQ